MFFVGTDRPWPPLRGAAQPRALPGHGLESSGQTDRL